MYIFSIFSLSPFLFQSYFLSIYLSPFSLSFCYLLSPKTKLYKLTYVVYLMSRLLLVLVSYIINNNHNLRIIIVKNWGEAKERIILTLASPNTIISFSVTFFLFRFFSSPFLTPSYSDYILLSNPIQVWKNKLNILITFLNLVH